MVSVALTMASEGADRDHFALWLASRNPRLDERFAKIQGQTVQQGVSHTEEQRSSALKHRQAAEDDRRPAERKRKESEADLASGRSPTDAGQSSTKRTRTSGAGTGQVSYLPPMR